jgi:hypothetical protein
LYPTEAKERWSTPTFTVRSRANRRRHRHKYKLSGIHIIMAAILLAIMTFASISIFEWLWGSFLNCSMFTLGGVSIEGNHRVSSADILDAANLGIGTDSVYSVMSHIIQKRIESQFRYLERVKVKRGIARKQGGWIHGWVTIEVQEREPVALVEGYSDSSFLDEKLEQNFAQAFSKGLSFMIIDNRGFILEEGIRPPREGMPVIVGVRGIALTNSGGAMPLELKVALDIIENARSVIPELFHEISYIDVRDQDDIILALDTGSEEDVASLSASVLSPESTPMQRPVSSKTDIRLASDRIREAMVDILPVIMKRRAENKKTECLDARFPGAVYCTSGSDLVPEDVGNANARVDS